MALQESSKSTHGRADPLPSPQGPLPPLTPPRDPRRQALRLTRPEGLDPALTEPHIANRLVSVLTNYFRKECGSAFVEEVVEACGLPVSYLEDTERWVSSNFAERFANTLASRLTGSSAPPGYAHPVWQHWRKAGWDTFSPNASGAFVFLVRSFGSPSLAFGQASTLIQQGNRLTQATLMLSSPGLCVLRVFAMEPSHPDLPCSCWSRIGLFEAMPTLWGLPKAEVEHTICMHQPPVAPYCEYRITYEDRRIPRWLAPLLAMGVGAVAGGLLSLAAFSSQGLEATGIGALAALAAEGWRRVFFDARITSTHSAQLQILLKTSDERYDQLWAEQRSLRRALLINRKIAGYLAPEVVEKLTGNLNTEIELGGVSTHAAVLFADLVGFTHRCERASPKEIVDELNLYFAHVDPIITHHFGIIDKRIGDGIMVVFAARDGETPLETLHHRAVCCGIEMLRAMSACNQELKVQRAAPMQIRVGLAAGPLVQGNMGSKAKLEYTVIGDVVNIAARLEGLATPGHLLMEATLLEVVRGEYQVKNEREVRVKGREQPVKVVELEP